MHGRESKETKSLLTIQVYEYCTAHMCAYFDVLLTLHVYRICSRLLILVFKS